ncbi:MAG: 4a-hydroxytetrahydrobiopterin dehydratase [Yoonia sp.]|uniref:4a-hydroxytetrahydrobiopterin dehydratase n=1 Tax=Yoonia sp. TaxID=2212373 RepID=UPI003EF9A721
MTDKLTDAERMELIDPLLANGWTLKGENVAIEKTFTFTNFVEAFGFMTRAAIHAEKLNHHPEWSNVYKTVNVTLTTHDVDGLSALDAKLGAIMDKLAGG